MTAKVWRGMPPPPAGFGPSIGLSPFQGHLLFNRGIRHRDQVEPFFAADTGLNDPRLLPDMDKAVDRLQRALASDETIAVFGDFDTDGVAGTALLVRALRELDASVVPYLPHRNDEGHGLNDDALRRLREDGASLLVTVDCGSSSATEVALAASLGLDTIVTDHHSLPPSPPEACALVNPRRSDSHYPYAHLTGAGLAFKLAEALCQAAGQPRPDHLLELATLGTVADVAPLTGENRYIVKMGLEKLNKTKQLGLRALVAEAGLRLGSLDTESLSFGLIPRLNAAGRLDDASLSLDLLTSTSQETAEAIADSLNRQNGERQRLTEEGMAEAVRQVENESVTPSIIIVSHREWLPGILGLIAGKLSEQFYRPAVAMAIGDDLCRASARSIPEFDIVDAFNRSAHLFTRYGGHPRAAGFTISTANLPRLVDELTAFADNRLRDFNLQPVINFDCEIPLALLNGDNVGFIQSLAPFGEGNRAPVFLTREARVFEKRQVGRDQGHLKMRVGGNGKVVDAIAFRQGHKVAEAQGRIDMVYSAGLNNWSDPPKLQLTVVDFRTSRSS